MKRIDSLVVLCLFILFLTGLVIGYSQRQIVVETHEVYAEVPVYVEKEIVVEHTIVETVERLVPQALTDFESVDELREFLAGDDTDKHIFLKADESGVIELNNQCEDIALQLQKRATLVGKKLDTEILSRTDSARWQQYLNFSAYTLGETDGHVICKAFIGNEVWFIEPSNDNIWLAYYLD